MNRLLYGRALGRVYEQLGFHIVPNHFYSPIPDSRDLELHTARFTQESALVGIDMRLAQQLSLLQTGLAPWFAECDFPIEKPKEGGDYYAHNGSYGHFEASILHAIIRHIRPARIIEVGSGWSTLITGRACEMNKRDGMPVAFEAIEPFPRPLLQKSVPGLTRLILQKVEEVPMEMFTSLRDGDILFIDSSHVVKSFSDVNFLYLEVLPRLAKGVIVHIHDIFFPFEYPRDWVVRRRWFWSEQYLLHAFLMFNDTFEVMISESYLRAKAAKELASAYPYSLAYDDNFDSNSLWMRRVK